MYFCNMPFYSKFIHIAVTGKSLSSGALRLDSAENLNLSFHVEWKECSGLFSLAAFNPPADYIYIKEKASDFFCTVSSLIRTVKRVVRKAEILFRSRIGFAAAEGRQLFRRKRRLRL